MTEVPTQKLVEDFNAEDLLGEIQKRGRAKRKLIDFASYMDEAFEAHPIHEMIAAKLEEVESGACRRLAIFIPPSSGKSELVSRIFPAWSIGRNPRLKFIHASYNADLAASFGRVIRDKVRDPRYRNIFDTQLDPDAMARDQWATTAGGTYKAEGVGGGLIGFHAHIALIDDPVKDWEQASSDSQREGLYNWFTSVLLNRLRPYKSGPGAIVLIMQRWLDDDLGGRIKLEGGWDVLEIGSLAESDDPLGRAEGEALIPSWRSKEELHAIRDRNPIQFMALHQQKPVPDTGEVFNPEWFQYYDQLPRGLSFHGASDYAISDGGGDFSVHLCGGLSDSSDLYLCDLWREQAETAIWVDALIEIIKRRNPIEWAEEGGAIIKGVGPFIKRRLNEEGVYIVRRNYPSIGNKRARAATFAGMAQMGKIWLPRNASWVGPFLHELARFPRGANDDQVDAGSLLCRMVVKSIGGDLNDAPARPQEPMRNLTFDEMVGRAKARRTGRRIRSAAPFVVEESYVQDVRNLSDPSEVFEKASI